MLELESLIDYNRNNPAINSDFFLVSPINISGRRLYINKNQYFSTTEDLLYKQCSIDALQSLQKSSFWLEKCRLLLLYIAV